MLRTRFGPGNAVSYITTRGTPETELTLTPVKKESHRTTQHLTIRESPRTTIEDKERRKRRGHASTFVRIPEHSNPGENFEKKGQRLTCSHV